MSTARPTAAQRGYGSARWKKARATFLAEHRWCRLCAERGVRSRSTRVDHIVPHRGDQRLFWDRSNWQALCQTCHDGAKQAQERTGHLRGCDEHGVPLDPAHPWRRGRAKATPGGRQNLPGSTPPRPVPDLRSRNRDLKSG